MKAIYVIEDAHVAQNLLNNYMGNPYARGSANQSFMEIYM
jgi:hypothetical protein